MSTQKRQMIEVTVKNTSPWKDAMADALQSYFERWGYQVSRIKDGDSEVFIGVERRP